MPPTNEVWCGPPNATAKVRPVKPQPASTLRMIKRLQKIRDEADPRSNSLLNDRRAKMMEQQLSQTTNLLTKAKIGFQLSQELLNGGRSQAAMQQLQAAIDILPTIGARLPPDIDLNGNQTARPMKIEMHGMP
jgi:hypothetical protein